MNIGFIGLGRMGFAMASNLAAAGHALFLYDSAAAVMEKVKTIPGAQPAGSPAEVAEQSEVVFTALPNDEIVLQVYLGSDGIAAGAREGLVTCDCSTVSPEVSNEIAGRLTREGTAHLDTPMLGSQPQAEEGSLFFIVAGDPDAHKKVTPLLDVIGKMHMHVGATGAGNRIKLIHNALGAVNSVAVSESLALCARTGIDL